MTCIVLWRVGKEGRVRLASIDRNCRLRNHESNKKTELKVRGGQLTLDSLGRVAKREGSGMWNSANLHFLQRTRPVPSKHTGRREGNSQISAI